MLFPSPKPLIMIIKKQTHTNEFKYYKVNVSQTIKAAV